MDYTILSDELTNDPLVRGYSAMSDSAAADDINLIYRPSANVIAEMVKYLINKKHRTNQGSDDTYTSIIGRLKHVARSSAGDDPFGRASGGYAGLDIQHIHACQAFVTLIESQHLADLDYGDSSLPWGYVEASGAWANDPHTLALQALSENRISRGSELSIGRVAEGDVLYARTL